MSVKKAVIILISIGFLGSSVFFIIINKKEKKIYSTEKIKRASLIETVSETGTIKSSDETNLSFLNSGKIAKVNVNIGDKVKKGDVLAELDYSSLKIKKMELKAAVDVASANFNKIISGATKEDIAVAAAAAKQAKTAYEASVKEYDKNLVSLTESEEQAKNNLNDLLDSSMDTLTTYEQSITSAEANLKNTKLSYQQAIDNYKESYLNTLEDKSAVAKASLNLIDTILNDSDLDNKFSVKNIIYSDNTKKTYDEALNLLTEANLSIAQARKDNSNKNAVEAINKSLEALNKVFNSLKECYSALENTVTSSSFSSSNLETYKTSVASEQSKISLAITSVQEVKQGIDGAILNYNTYVSSAENSLLSAKAAYDTAVLNAQNALKNATLNKNKVLTSLQSKVDNSFEAWQLAQSQLNKVKAPANSHDIDLARAKLNQAKASFDAVLEQIDNSIIKAPLDGVITESNYEIGEQISIGQTMFKLLTQNSFDTEVLISEADIAKLKVGDYSEITLDAFGDDIIFKARVTFIEPAETIIQDVVYYKATLSFVNRKNQENINYFDKIKPGMTANVTITTDKRENVLVIPFRAIIDKGELGKFTRVFRNNSIEERKIKIGLKGDGGLTEVLSGLKEGEEVVTYISEKK